VRPWLAIRLTFAITDDGKDFEQCGHGWLPV